MCVSHGDRIKIEVKVKMRPATVSRILQNNLTARNFTIIFSLKKCKNISANIAVEATDSTLHRRKQDRMQ